MSIFIFTPYCTFTLLLITKITIILNIKTTTKGNVTIKSKSFKNTTPTSLSSTRLIFLRNLKPENRVKTIKSH